MSGQIVTIEKNDAAIIQALKSSLYPGAKDESVAMVLSYCKAAQLDPMTKPVHLVPMNVKDSKTGKYDWRDVVMPGIELYRTKASRTTEPEFGPTVEKIFKGKDKDGNEKYSTKIILNEMKMLGSRNNSEAPPTMGSEGMESDVPF